MKSLARFALVAAFALVVPLAGAAPMGSLISAYAGPHNGTLSFVGVAGSTTGSFKTSNTKEVGTLTLVSSVPGGDETVSLNEQLKFNKKSVTWSLIEQLLPSGLSVVVSGAGRAVIKKKVITYSFPVSIGGLVGTLSGKIILASNGHLAVQETISGDEEVITLVYQLGGKKPKK